LDEHALIATGTGGAQLADLNRLPDASSKSFLVLFFKKELLVFLV
jgi:hypothetical protein